MRSEFSLNQKHTELGLIPDPIIPVAVLTMYGYQKFDFLVDTGADCSMMPKSVAQDLGIKLSSLPVMHFRGIEGKGISVYLTKITIKITNIPVKITCTLSSNEQSPFILGRKDIFNKFNIFFDNRSKVIAFTDIS